MEKKKIYHIHTDFKFLYDSYRFENPMFDNQLIFIGEKDVSNSAYHETALFFSKEHNSFEFLLKLVIDADLIVFYAICDTKINLLNQLPSNIKTAWRFFGYELYGTRHDLMYSRKTIETMYKRKSYVFSIVFWLNFYYKNFIRRLQSRKKLRYIDKIDYILLFAEEEYEFLRKHWKVPKFLRLNLDELLSEGRFSSVKNQLIVGNSRSSFNNHLDIFSLIPSHYSDANFVFFLNYGNKGRYYQELLEKVYKINNYTIFDEFLNKEEFERIYSTSSALVLNSYRQMALGNIFMAMKYGLKIYLNNKNPLKAWLLHNGINVSSIADLEADLQNQSLSLTEAERIQNINSFNNLFLSYTKEDFCNKVLEIL